MSLIFSLFSRVVGAVAVILLVLIIGRQYSSEHAGLILFLFASTQFLMGLSRGGTEVDLLEASRNRSMADGYDNLLTVARRAFRRSLLLSVPVAIVASLAFMTSDQARGLAPTVALFALSIIPGALILLEIEVLRGIGQAAAATFLQTGAIQVVLIPIALLHLGGATGFALAFALVHVVVLLVTAVALRRLLRQHEATISENAEMADLGLSELQERNRGWVVAVELLRIAFVWAPLLFLYWKGSAEAILEFSVAGRMAAAVGLLVPAFLNFLAPSQVAKYVEDAQIPAATLMFGLGVLIVPAVMFGIVATIAPSLVLEVSGIATLSADEFLRLLLALIAVQTLMGLASFFLQERLIGRFEKRSAVSLGVAFIIVLTAGITFVGDFDATSAALVALVLQAGALCALATPKIHIAQRTLSS